MRTFLRKQFRFILDPLEKGDAPFTVNPLSRKVLIVMGFLFSALSSGSIIVFFLSDLSEPISLFPGVVFLIVGLLCLIVGCLGSDRAVAKVWGDRNT